MTLKRLYFIIFNKINKRIKAIINKITKIQIVQFIIISDMMHINILLDGSHQINQTIN